MGKYDRNTPLGRSRDETGKVYGDLKVLRYVGRTLGVAKHAVFECECSCGNIVNVIGSNLRRSHTTSCGHDRIKLLHEGLKEYNKNYIPKDLEGEIFGDLRVKYFVGWETAKGATSVTYSLWECLCSCGNIVTTRRSNLSDSSSCGCKWRERQSVSLSTHGMSKTSEYSSWIKMKERCYSKHYRDPQYYKDKGVKVCDRWINSFENFYNDMGDCPKGYSLDRIDPDGDYDPKNCRWASLSIQAFNQIPTNNSSGRVGVYKSKNGTYQASICVDGKNIYLGGNLDFEKASEVRRKAEIKYFGFAKDEYMKRV